MKAKWCEDIPEVNENTYGTEEEEKPKAKRNLFGESSDSQDDQWGLKKKISKDDKQIKQQKKRLQRNYVDFGDKSEQDSDNTDSDDIENQKKHFKMGYRPLASKQHNGYKGMQSDTVTEESDDGSNKFGGRDMKAIYSTKLDKHLSEGELDDSENYEQDGFEDVEDPDDDFNLPRNHQQNHYDHPKVKVQNLLKKQPKYTSTGSQVIQEEQKQQDKKLDKLNQEMQKEIYVKSAIKKLTITMKVEGEKALQSQDLNQCYLFIRRLSANVSFSSLKKMETEYVELAVHKMTQNILEIIRAEKEAKLMEDLLNQPQIGQSTASKNKKKKKNKTGQQETVTVQDDVVVIKT